MSYCKMTVTAGKTVEVKVYHTRTQKSKNAKRVRTGQPSSEERQRANLKASEERLRWKMNANFKGGDLSLILNYTMATGCKTRTPEEMKEDFADFISKLRTKYRKRGLELKYVYVPEIGTRGSRHIHITVNYIDVRIIQQCWPHGRIRFENLDRDGNYRKLAAYYIKYSEKTFRTLGRLMGKRYSCSRNLKEPVISRRIIKRSDTFSRRVRVPKGYYLDKDSEEYGVDIYGHIYFRYILVKLE